MDGHNGVSIPFSQGIMQRSSWIHTLCIHYFVSKQHDALNDLCNLSVALRSSGNKRYLHILPKVNIPIAKANPVRYIIKDYHLNIVYSKTATLFDCSIVVTSQDRNMSYNPVIAYCIILLLSPAPNIAIISYINKKPLLTKVSLYIKVHIYFKGFY